jgi:hypothetical protein
VRGREARAKSAVSTAARTGACLAHQAASKVGAVHWNDTFRGACIRTDPMTGEPYLVEQLPTSDLPAIPAIKHSRQYFLTHGGF